MKIFKKYALISLLVLAFVIPQSSHAVTMSELQVQINSLLQQIQQLQLQLSRQTGNSPPKIQQPYCNPIPLTINLYLGLSDYGTNGEVTKLQEFLAEDSTIYPEGLVTGFFGSLTERAVKRWQAKQGVVSSGTPKTTGYGVVGPKTREKIRGYRCGQIPETPTSESSSPKITGVKYNTLTPKVNEAVSFFWSATDEDNYNLCWTVTWGDGTGGKTEPCSYKSGFDGLHHTFEASNAWKQSGIYTVKVTVSDGIGGSDTKSYTVTVGDESVSSVSITSISNSVNPYVTGIAKGLDTVGFTIDDGDKVYGSGPIPVVKESWSHKVSTDLKDGKYTLIVVNVDGVEMARKSFVVGDVSYKEATITFFKASDQYVSSGGSTKLWWSANYANTCFITTQVGDSSVAIVKVGLPVEGSLDVPIDWKDGTEHLAIIYNLICSGDSQTGKDDNSDKKSISIYYKSVEIDPYATDRFLDVTYENGSITPDNAGVTVKGTADYSATIDTKNVREGRYAIRYELRESDEMIDGGTRAESDAIFCDVCRYGQGDDIYYGFSIYIPENWVNDGWYEDILYQWHNIPDYNLGESSKNPNMFLAVKRNEFVLRTTYDDALVSNSGSVTKEQVTLVPSITSGWNDFVFRVHWSYENNGITQVWHKTASQQKYIQVLNKSGANMHNDRLKGYLKWGMYKPSWNGDGQSLSATKRVVNFDNVRVGTSFNSVISTQVLAAAESSNTFSSLTQMASVLNSAEALLNQIIEALKKFR